MRAVLAVGAALVLALAGCGDDDDSGGGEPATADATTVRETTSTTVDPVATWCAIEWAEVDRQAGDPTTDSSEGLDFMLDVAERGTELGHPDIAAAAADIVDAITWPDRLAEDPTTPAPDPAAFTGAILTIGFACDEAVRP